MNKMKKKYQYVTLALVLVLVLAISIILEVQPKWYVYIIIYILSMIIGKFIYVLQKGVNLPKVQFVDSESEYQLFYGELQLGFSKIIQIKGTFNNSIGFSERDITSLIYNNTTREMVMPLYKYGKQVTLSFKVNDSLIEVSLNEK